MNLQRYVSLGLALAFAISLAVIGHVAQQKDALRAAASTAGHAVDKGGKPVTLSTKGAIAQIRILGAAVDQARQARADAAAKDATHALTVERADARTNQEVSNDVLAKFDRVQAELAASRALAAQRMRELAAARADQGGGGAPAGPADPDATCRAHFAASCDDVLALLAEAERNTAVALGWQAFWAGIAANHADGGAND
ncbi:hypothetical protein [Sphingomonas pituitosa]|uniref:hypothetical protein n=1 Tax=Sphingomonas pituitosa TaxID=99597 RepID=UPI00082B8848|nr:hypothetical protein [Sphingomonas pituitosa]